MKKISNKKKLIKQFLLMDCGALVFGIVFFLITNMIGEKTTILGAAIATIIFWIFDFVLRGFLGKFKEC
ncbi:hypothetical protein [Leuconostoc suionicum]|uniref:hypothetical protein n=1 Tax=Leuconostoc suionicum TaxID=1511761 RepID=UPI0021A9F709|nr:hypothetical protein [Leuconostoc suionicum]MCT4382705.1 hypothetical protein [Leuconostoc suionicum]